MGWKGIRAELKPAPNATPRPGRGSQPSRHAALQGRHDAGGFAPLLATNLSSTSVAPRGAPLTIGDRPKAMVAPWQHSVKRRGGGGHGWGASMLRCVVSERGPYLTDFALDLAPTRSKCGPVLSWLHRVWPSAAKSAGMQLAHKASLACGSSANVFFWHSPSCPSCQKHASHVLECPGLHP